MSTAENAAEYVSRVNLKSLAEWMVAEAVLSRPRDPVTFCRDLLSQHIKARKGASEIFLTTDIQPVELIPGRTLKQASSNRSNSQNS